MDPLLAALGLTMIAGLATGVGGAIGAIFERIDDRWHSAALGFAAGVMLQVSFVSLFPGAREVLAEHRGEDAAYWIAALGFFGGIAVIGLGLLIKPVFPSLWDRNREAIVYMVVGGIVLVMIPTLAELIVGA